MIMPPYRTGGQWVFKIHHYLIFLSVSYEQKCETGTDESVIYIISIKSQDLSLRGLILFSTRG